ncbi:MAG TPA: hypothetical protein VNT03_02440 [Baekduia sp.]|nr:hypothetical protein [Baekduia sp.]
MFGTMVADGIKDGAGLSCAVTTPVFAAIVGATFWRWHRSEGTLDIHTITSRRREGYYWCAVLATFALGTAAGDHKEAAPDRGSGAEFRSRSSPRGEREGAHAANVLQYPRADVDLGRSWRLLAGLQ